MERPPQKLFLYARKSTDDKDKQVRSIGDQIAVLHEYAESNGIEVVRVFTEKKSAKRPGRKVFEEMLGRIAEGEAGGILSWNPDRLARNMADGAKVIDMVETHGAALRFPTFHFEKSPYGLFCLSLAFGQSKLFIDTLAENVKRGMNQKAKEGVYPNKAPTGYLNDRFSKRIVPDPVRAPLVQEMFEKYATGEYAFRELSFETRYGKMLSPQNVKAILQNPLYYGVFRYKGELYEGVHEPLITKKRFDEIQEIIKTRGRTQLQHKKEKYPFRHLLVCAACGCTITSSVQKGHIYYHCTKRRGKCPGRYVREEVIVEEIQRCLQNVSLPLAHLEYIEKHLQEIAREEKEQHTPRTTAVRTKINGCEEKLNILLNMSLLGDITREEYLTKKNELTEQKTQLEEKLRTAEGEGNEWFEPAQSFIQQAKTIEKITLSPDHSEKAKLFRMVGLNRKLHQFSVQYKPRGAWRVLQQQGEHSERLTKAQVTMNAELSPLLEGCRTRIRT